MIEPQAKTLLLALVIWYVLAFTLYGVEIIGAYGLIGANLAAGIVGLGVPLLVWFSEGWKELSGE